MALVELARALMSERDSDNLHRIADSLEMIARALCPEPPDTEVDVEAVDEWEPEPVRDESAGLDENMDISEVLELAREDARRAAREYKQQQQSHGSGGNGATRS